MRAGPQSHFFWNSSLTSDFNDEVDEVNIEVIKFFSHEIQDLKLKFIMMNFLTFNFLIQEKYDAYRVVQFL